MPTQSPCTTPFDRSLVAYALASGAVASSASGAVVYSGTQNLSLSAGSGTANSLAIDVNGGGTDFTLSFLAHDSVGSAPGRLDIVSSASAASLGTAASKGVVAAALLGGRRDLVVARSEPVGRRPSQTKLMTEFDQTTGAAFAGDWGNATKYIGGRIETSVGLRAVLLRLDPDQHASLRHRQRHRPRLGVRDDARTVDSCGADGLGGSRRRCDGALLARREWPGSLASPQADRVKSLRDGVTVRSVEVDRPPRREAASLAHHGLATMTPPRRLLLIGLDGLGVDLVHPAIDAGLLPAIERLVSAGSSGGLVAGVSTDPAVAWTTLATGTRPDRHRVLDGMVFDPVAGDLRPVDGWARRVARDLEPRKPRRALERRRRLAGEPSRRSDSGCVRLRSLLRSCSADRRGVAGARTVAASGGTRSGARRTSRSSR